MAEASELTKGNDRLHLVFAFNYGSRREIAAAARALAERVAEGAMALDAIDESTLGAAMYLPDMPDVDLIIRSSGEHRLSNFLLWQAAYAEFSFPGILWPDFDRHHLLEAVLDYQTRDRRFGAAEDRPGVEID
jgi:undecaprenyl diphosphate synthase